MLPTLLLFALLYPFIPWDGMCTNGKLHCTIMPWFATRCCMLEFKLILGFIFGFTCWFKLVLWWWLFWLFWLFIGIGLAGIELDRRPLPIERFPFAATALCRFLNRFATLSSTSGSNCRKAARLAIPCMSPFSCMPMKYGSLVWLLVVRHSNSSIPFAWHSSQARGMGATGTCRFELATNSSRTSRR